ncbi:hypothetical protein L7F22_002742 [Adiantum nelumboides]|nr:hypothetical protein [Adiantum nelumboides]
MAGGKDEGLLSSMYWSYMPLDDLGCDVNDMHVDILDDVFFPPSDVLSWYPNDLWACGPIWDADLGKDHVCGTELSTGASLHSDQKVACSQSDDYGTCVANDGDCDWVFDDPQVDMDERMQVNVFHALSRLQKQRQDSHVCGVNDVNYDLESCDSHVEVNPLDVVPRVDVSNMAYGGENEAAWFYDWYGMIAWSLLVLRAWPCNIEECHHVGEMDDKQCTRPFDHETDKEPFDWNALKLWVMVVDL